MDINDFVLLSCGVLPDRRVVLVITQGGVDEHFGLDGDSCLPLLQNALGEVTALSPG